ncbi:MAG: hypothetical protein V8S56_06530 [Lachnospiraceae bacterium]
MKKFRNLKQKIIFYVMSVSILLTVLITAVMSFGSIRSTNKLQLDNIQVTTRDRIPKHQFQSSSSDGTHL